MNNNNKILSDITVHMKYAKYIPELNRRETWEELVTRNKEMHQKKYPELYLLGFNHKDPTSDAKKYLKDDGNPYNFVGVDSDGLIALEFGVFGLPETYLINEDGKIIYKFMGPITMDILKNEIEPLL